MKTLAYSLVMLAAALPVWAASPTQPAAPAQPVAPVVSSPAAKPADPAHESSFVGLPSHRFTAPEPTAPLLKETTPTAPSPTQAFTLPQFKPVDILPNTAEQQAEPAAQQ